MIQVESGRRSCDSGKESVEESNVELAKLELDLKIWKDIAVSKQVMMRAATDALGLEPDCSTDDLRKALEVAVKRANDADASVKEAQDRAKTAVAEMERRLSVMERARAESEAAKEKALAAQQSAEQRAIAENAAHAKELEKFKNDLAAKQKSLRDINVALADTPENVIKKLKALRKQKNDEATARQKADADVRKLRKEKQSLEKRLEDIQPVLDGSPKLIEQHREAHRICTELFGKLKSSVAEGEELPEIPELDQELIDGMEKAMRDDEKDKKKS